MERYQIRLQHYRNGARGRTSYEFATKYQARAFVQGYTAALHDTGYSDLYVHIVDTNTGKSEVYK